MLAHGDWLTIHGDDRLLSAPPVAWATGVLREAATARPDRVDAHRTPIEVAVVDVDDPAAPERTPTGAESHAFRTEAGADEARRVVIAAADDRGRAYALTEVAERLRARGAAGLPIGELVVDRPAVPVRGIQRNFSSVHEDTPWFHDRRFWGEYLDHLALQRFNRFQLALGMQYNYGTGWESRTATDNYLCFAYPFLLEVPGHQVRAQGVDAVERARNLDSLAFIAREVKRRGMHFQLGLWNHAYDFGFDSPHEFPILGVSEENHASYSADALRLLLETVPEIDGITFRVHHEGGIHEEGHERFWDAMFTAASEVGRPLEIDMHAKGVDAALVEAVRKPNLRPVISGKYWAEHMGLPYHQTSIRQMEREPLLWPGADRSMTGVTNGDRRFTRYGYGDFLAEDRPVDFMFRMWPGTQKLLLWGDPAIAAGFGRCATIGGSRGLELCEPLTFKGRRGTGVPGGREVYERGDLRLGVDDWKKFSYTYLLWGRLLYAPDAEPEVWRRHLRAEHGPAAGPLEDALAPLSRILPLMTVVHGVSGANNFYWPEMYVDLAVSYWKQSSHYAFDIPEPRTWEGVSSFDPTLFYAVGEYADAVLADAVTAKHTPLEVAGWIDRMVEDGERALEEAALAADGGATTTRALVDARVLVQLGRFFSGKLRAATSYAIARRVADAGVMARAVDELREAHAAYARIPGIVEGIYRTDLAFGVGVAERGSWRDRTMAMREDLFLLTKELEQLRARTGDERSPRRHRSSRPRVELQLRVPERFERGEAMEVRLEGDDPRVTGATLRFRRLNQAEDVQALPMHAVDGGFAASVPGDYTDSTFPLLVFAEAVLAGEPPVFVPGFADDLANQPYHVVHSTDWREHGSSRVS